MCLRLCLALLCCAVLACLLAVLRCAMLCFALLCYALICSDLLCLALLALLCFALLCLAVLGFASFCCALLCSTPKTFKIHNTAKTQLLCDHKYRGDFQTNLFMRKVEWVAHYAPMKNLHDNWGAILVKVSREAKKGGPQKTWSTKHLPFMTKGRNYIWSAIMKDVLEILHNLSVKTQFVGFHLRDYSGALQKCLSELRLYALAPNTEGCILKNTLSLHKKNCDNPPLKFAVEIAMNKIKDGKFLLADSSVPMGLSTKSVLELMTCAINFVQIVHDNLVSRESKVADILKSMDRVFSRSTLTMCSHKLDANEDPIADGNPVALSCAEPVQASASGANARKRPQDSNPSEIHPPKRPRAGPIVQFKQDKDKPSAPKHYQKKAQPQMPCPNRPGIPDEPAQDVQVPNVPELERLRQVKQQLTQHTEDLAKLAVHFRVDIKDLPIFVASTSCGAIYSVFCFLVSQRHKQDSQTYLSLVIIVKTTNRHINSCATMRVEEFT